MILHYDPKTQTFYLQCGYHESDHARRAGFAWDKQYRMWKTGFAATAAPFAKTEKERAFIAAKAAVEQKTYQASCATWSEFAVPLPPGVELKRFQKAGCEFMRDKASVLLADQMGLGKTVQAIGVYNMLSEGGKFEPRTLIVCPASLKRNWAKELSKWALKARFGIAEGNTMPNTPVVIVNYDIVNRHKALLHEVVWDLVILDECQYLKNNQAQRTQALYGYRFQPGLNAKRKLALTGTPILNRPIEIFSTLKFLQPENWRDKHEFAKRYCDATQTRFGWDYNGASNLEELQVRLRSSLMLRRLKKDVLRELPAKVRQVIEIDPDAAGRRVLQKEKALFGEVLSKQVKDTMTEQEYRELIRVMQGGQRVGFEEMSTVRRENAEAKIPAVTDHLKDCLEQEDKVVVFAHHKSVVQALAAEFGKEAVVVDGDTPLEKRQQNVEAFQGNPKVRLFIGNIIAAGTGLTLTAASHVVFAELDWVPGNVTQAEDRCHRIGQTASVLVQHLVLAGSIDAVMAKAIVQKQDVIEQALDTNLDDKVMEALQ